MKINSWLPLKIRHNYCQTYTSGGSLYINDSFEKSLQNLKTDYVDLLLIHFPVFTTSLSDMLKILYKLKYDDGQEQIYDNDFEFIVTR